MEISVQVDEAFAAEIDPDLIQKALMATFEHYPPSSTGSISVVITDNETVRELNHRYRGVNAPTDVLSFENLPDPDFPQEALTMAHLGDIVIAFPVAKAQALAAGHSPLEEVVLLSIHGALHLLGFDHDTAERKKEMWAAQSQIMTHLGLAHIQPTET